MKIGRVLGEIILVLHKHKQLNANDIYKKGNFKSIQTLLCALTNYCNKKDPKIPLRRKKVEGVFVYYLLPSWAGKNQAIIAQLQKESRQNKAKKPAKAEKNILAHWLLPFSPYSPYK